MRPKLPRCINLDWFEIDALEPPEGRPFQYFLEKKIFGFQRDYGTRVYREMFTLDGTDGQPLLEIRRKPVSDILDPRDCHIRLVNRTCYFTDAVTLLGTFLRVHGYEFQRIHRVDICLDFEKFDSDDNPQSFINRYIAGAYSKINQSNITSHGTDQFDGRKWNSLSWGSPTSDISTKMYDKTMELYDPTTKSYKKPYIRQAWQECGLIDDWQKVTATDKEGKTYTPRIWRIEFSIRSSVKRWFLINRNGNSKEKQSIRNTMECYDSREKLITLFASLTQHYFHFKHFEPNKTKYQCKDKELFCWQDQQSVYKVEKVVSANLADRPLNTLLAKIREYKAQHLSREVHDACNVLINAMSDEVLRYEAGHHFTLEELTALRLAMAAKTRGYDKDVTLLMREIKELLNINDQTLQIYIERK